MTTTKNCILATVNIYQNIVSAKKENKKLLAVLIDPEKMEIKNIADYEKSNLPHDAIVRERGGFRYAI